MVCGSGHSRRDRTECGGLKDNRGLMKGRLMFLMVMMMMVVAPEFPFDAFAVPSGFLGFVAFLALLRQSTAATTAVGQLVVIVSDAAAVIIILIGLLGDALDAKNFVLGLKVAARTASVLAEAST